MANYRVRKITPAGTVSTIAGTGHCCYSGDGGAATSTDLDPTVVAVDSGGNVYIDGYARVLKIATNGIVTTVAGTGAYGYSGDNGPATSAQLSGSINGLAVDSTGNLYLSDQYNGRVRKVTPGGTITTVAGNGAYGYSGDGGLGTSAQLAYPGSLAVDAAGNLYIADSSNARVRRVAPDGSISTVAGNGNYGSSGDGGRRPAQHWARSIPWHRMPPAAFTSAPAAARSVRYPQEASSAPSPETASRVTPETAGRRSARN
jgi:hypothetical protein